MDLSPCWIKLATRPGQCLVVDLFDMDYNRPRPKNQHFFY
jgi:hypothetical protein